MSNLTIKITYEQAVILRSLVSREYKEHYEWSTVQPIIFESIRPYVDSLTDLLRMLSPDSDH